MAYSRRRLLARASWPKLAIYFVLLLLFHAAYAKPGNADILFEPIEADVVYRGEIKRTPDHIKARGGLLARDYELDLEGAAISARQRHQGSSLLVHSQGHGDSALYTRYVSTSTKRKIANDFALADDQGGVVYKIRADKRFVDVNASLQKYSKFRKEYEQAAIGYIAWEQIEGWWILTPEMKDKPHRIPDAVFHPNQDFDIRFID